LPSDQILLIVVIVLTMAAFAREWLPIDLVALSSLALLMLFGLVTPQEAISGFSNEAVITVMMIFVLSEGLLKSGLITKLAHRMAGFSGATHWRGTVLLITVAGFLSAFINNVAALTIFMPVSIHIAKHYRVSASKVLLPLSYATIFGGTCTLIGTSTNLLISSLSGEYGFRPFSMFEFASLGLILFAVGMVYTVLVMMRFLPDRQTGDSLAERYLGGFLSELDVPEGSKIVGRTIVEERVNERFRVSVLEIVRDRTHLAEVHAVRLQPGDRLILQGSFDDLVSFSEQSGLQLMSQADPDREIESGDNVLMEVQISPVSRLVGSNLRSLDFRRRFGANVLAMRRTGEIIRQQLVQVRLQRWDTLLVFGPRRQVEAFAARDDFVNLQEVGIHLELRRRWWIDLAIMVSVVGLASLGVVSILAASIYGVVALLVTRRLTMQEAYRAINWTVIFLVAAILPMGKAMVNTGLAARVGDLITQASAGAGPLVLLSILYLVTTILTEIMSNNSTAVLMVPVAISVAGTLNADPFPLIMTVAFAASASFLTPMGYKTNAMVYGPGGYRFMDYILFGAPLKVVFWLISVTLIPILWPWQPGG
jgi:di/tricarboxylate transporter